MALALHSAHGAHAGPPDGHGGHGGAHPRAYSDPVIFRDDRVLRTLLRKESRYLPAVDDYFTRVQTEIRSPQIRKEVADWMLEVCEDREAQPEVFCLAMNYLDRFLSVCPIGRGQLQLLGAVCLLVAFKVREHEPLQAAKLVEYSDFNLTLLDIMEWEVLLLSKLDWDMSSVIASDFIEHIIQRVERLNVGVAEGEEGVDPDVIRAHAEALITMCSAHHAFSCLAPSLVAAACVVTTLRPLMGGADTPTPRPLELDSILDEVERVTMLEKSCVTEVMDRVEQLLHESLPPSPISSPKNGDPDKIETPIRRQGSQEVDGEASNHATPTKILDVARSHH